MRISFVTLALALLVASPAVAEDNAAQIKKENERLRNELKQAEAKIAYLTKMINKLREAVVAAEIKSRTKADNLKLTEQRLEDLAKEYARSKAGKPVIPVPKNAVKGEIEKIEGVSMTINIGSDAGLEKGHHLEVYRTGADSRYLGKVVVVEVATKKSVVVARGWMSAPVQKGDKVVSKLTDAE